jgi:wyosine [tRNA(Phe)-imidazoG37] synthetase (radical SAM superfamily)
MAADAVLPSLDAGSSRLFQVVNRPHPKITFERQVRGLSAFSKAYQGHLWVEVMLIGGVNDTEKALRDLRTVLCRIRPNEVHISQPIRPPAETWVSPADSEGLMRATAILGEVAHIVHPVQGEFDLSGCHNVIDAVVGVISRHPMRQDELVRALSRWAPDSVTQALEMLAEHGRAQALTRYGHRFWTASGASYADTPRVGSLSRFQPDRQ